MSKFYDWLINIGSLDFGNRSALIIGGSEISKQYAMALSNLGVKDLVIIAKTGTYISDYCKDNKIELKNGVRLALQFLPLQDKFLLIRLVKKFVIFQMNL